MTSNLSVTKVGVYKLVVEKVPYVCSAFSLTMSINQIPTASCVVGCGRTILGSYRFENNAEDLYKEIQSRRQILTEYGLKNPCILCRFL